MELQEIEIVIGQDGRVQLQVRGVKGLTCLDLTKELEAVLGGQVEAREMTPEAGEAASEQVQQWQQQKNG
ncbi:MAG: DUF2997 domain-containing protein [Anaerolineae bacterium]|nr:DUF2997 domain-containing protein [Anaerolineae bacterium]